MRHDPATTVAGFDPVGALRLARLVFDTAVPYTVGVEEELLLLEPDGPGLAPVALEALDRLDGDDGFTKELRLAQIELRVPARLSPIDTSSELRSARTRLVRALDGLARPVGSGTALASGDPGPLTDGARYRTIADDCPLAARQLLTCGMHVHVAVRDAERAVRVHDALRTYLPVLGALAANSPFHGGRDTGMASMRAQLNRSLPRAGVPHPLGSWEDYEDFVRWGARGGTLADPSYHWWDLRLNPRCATIEVRVFDVQSRVEDAAALAALTQALVALLVERDAAGEQLPVHPTERIAENAWLAARDGTGGWLVDLDTGERVATAQLVERLVTDVEPVALELGTLELVHRALELLWDGGADRQRRAARLRGLDGAVDVLAAETCGTATPSGELTAPA